MTGGWANTIVPDAQGNAPRNGAAIEPGDLDEAIQAAIVIGDESSSDHMLGSAFEKIASFRQACCGGLEACTARDRRLRS